MILMNDSLGSHKDKRRGQSKDIRGNFNLCLVITNSKHSLNLGNINIKSHIKDLFNSVPFIKYTVYFLKKKLKGMLNIQRKNTV